MQTLSPKEQYFFKKRCLRTRVQVSWRKKGLPFLTELRCIFNKMSKVRLSSFHFLYLRKLIEKNYATFLTYFTCKQIYVVVLAEKPEVLSYHLLYLFLPL